MRINKASLIPLLFSSIALYSWPLFLSDSSYEKENSPCDPLPTPYRATIRHIEANGIGYQKGYSTFEIFAPLLYPSSRWVPFLDARAHVFNNGEPAVNAGVGVRYLSPLSWVFGVNAYYDYRKTHHGHYNQTSFGLEALGKVWDVRLNGYFPVGTTTYSSSGSSLRSSYFSGHRLYLGSGRQEFAMKGVNAEAGIHIKKMKYASFYGAFGPYYFEGKGKNAIGGEVRLSGTFLNRLKAEVSGSYDPIFGGIFQGQLSVVIPFGPRKQVAFSPSKTCSSEVRMYERALQPVDRNEIIVLDRRTQYTVAIDPLTGQPYTFWFVNNKSHSQGTFESPFNTLKDAENASAPHDVIYVYSGNGTSSGMDVGFTMQDYQKLFGAGIVQHLDTQIGTIAIPALSSGSPLITIGVNPGTPRGIIQLKNYTEVSGVHIVSASDFGTVAAGVLGGDPSATGSPTLGLTDLLIHNNTIEGEYLVGGVYLHNCYGDLNIINNTIEGISSSTTGGTGINCFQEYLSFDTTTLTCVNNQITDTQIDGLSWAGATTSSNALAIATITGNIVEDAQGNGITIEPQGTNTVINLVGNAVASTNLVGIFISGTNSGTTSSTTIEHNAISDTTIDSIVFNRTGTIGDITITENAIQNSLSRGIRIIPAQNPATLTITQNAIKSCSDSGINLLLAGSTTTCGNVSENAIQLSGLYGIYFEYQGSTPVKFAINDNAIRDTSGSASITLEAASSSICGHLTGNTLDKVTNCEEITSGIVNIDAYTDNSQAISGSYTPVADGTCSCD